MSERSTGPYVPALALRVGVSGHRDLSPAARDALAPRLAALLAEIAGIADAIVDEPGSLYAPRAARLSLVSQLASGVDQIAARAALDAGFALTTVLPFARDEFSEDFDEASRPAFDALIAQSAECWILPGDRAQSDAAYALAGEATVAQSDLLVAVWNGLPARGLGGTADVVDYAVRRGIPVLHIPLDESPPHLLWSALDGLPPVLFHRHDVPRRPLTTETLNAALRRKALPAGEIERLRL